MAFIELDHVEDLRCGLYVKLEGSWFSHPFPTNTFKIKSDHDLEILRHLQKVKILYDPDQSEDELPKETVPPLSTNQEEAKTVKHDSQAQTPTQDATPPVEESDRSKTLEQQQDFQEFYEHVRRVEGSYIKVLGQSTELFQQLGVRNKQGLKTADRIVGNLQTILQNPQTAMTLVDVMGGNGMIWGLSEHALNVCMLSLIIGRQMKLPQDELRHLGLGALFHDVGYWALPMMVRFHPGGMKVQADLEMLHRHPEQGYHIMQTFPGVLPTVLDVVAHHHERLDGSGFPQGLGKESLSVVTKILMVADYFDELCNAPDPTSSLTSHEALAYFYRHVVAHDESAKFCQHVVQALVQAIGVFPPGSLVELTDGSIGVVSSINLEAPTRPIVLLYAPWLPRTAGMIVNLEKVSDLDIKQALHPNSVETNVLAYLSPRRMAMFVHATDKISPFNRCKK